MLVDTFVQFLCIFQYFSCIFPFCDGKRCSNTEKDDFDQRTGCDGGQNTQQVGSNNKQYVPIVRTIGVHIFKVHIETSFKML